MSVVLAFACKKDRPATIAPDPSSRPVDAAVPIDPIARRGCRAPFEPGCEQCCEPTPDGKCIQRTAQTDWYNGVHGLPGSCPSSCSPCASCSLRDEQGLRARSPRPECDCTRPVGRDPCIYVPETCECYCLVMNDLWKRCPPAP